MHKPARTSRPAFAPVRRFKDAFLREVAPWLILPALVFALTPWSAGAQAFQFPTANRTLLAHGGGDQFFVGTVGRPWTSGCFGCVRSEGWQMHEGVDIRCLQRDKRGEPTDPILATADGTVAYVNAKPSLSNYGIYVVLRHRVGGLEVYSLYAHLSGVKAGLKAGQNVKAGQAIGTMGHTSNTAQQISKDRAHVHFELNFFVSDRFPEWFKKNFPGERNDHGEWNGQNMLGLDPALILVGANDLGAKFNLLRLVREQPALCRVFVRDVNFSWVKRYAPLVRPNPISQKQGIAGYELALNYNGLPFEIIPRAASEVKGRARFQLLSVNETEQKRNPCRRLVTKKGSAWELTARGERLLDLLTY